MRGIVAERERGGAFGSAGGLAGRCGASRDSLERLAWAGACDSLCAGGRREALWLVGIASAGRGLADGVQLALPLETGAAPALPELGAWERQMADYASTGVSLHDHPLELLRPELAPDVLSSAELAQARDGARVRVAGLVLARQRPSTAKGVLFMLLEDEHGTINLIVPPPAYDRFRLAIRTEPLVLAEGRLERRHGNLNVLVSALRRLERPGQPLAEVTELSPAQPPATSSRIRPAERLREAGPDFFPAAHSFGRRGR